MSLDEVLTFIWAAGAAAGLIALPITAIRRKFPRQVTDFAKRRPLAFALLLAFILFSWPVWLVVVLVRRRQAGEPTA